MPTHPQSKRSELPAPVAAIVRSPHSGAVTALLWFVGALARRWRLATLLRVLCIAGVTGVASEGATVNLGSVQVELQDVSSEVQVSFQGMRLNRALDVWNVEMAVTNISSRRIAAPLVAVVDVAAGTTGLLQGDGQVEGKTYLDLTPRVAGGSLAPGQGTPPRTLTLGRIAGGTPKLTLLVLGRPPPPADLALALTRSLDPFGQPLPGVTVTEQGPAGTASQEVERLSAIVTLGQGPGPHSWRFEAPGYLPVWRQADLVPGVVTTLPHPRLTPRATGTAALTPLGGSLSNASGSILITLAPASLSQASTAATLTPLTGQTLPAFLPGGWSPLQAFWFEISNRPVAPAVVSVIPWGPVVRGEPLAWVRWDATGQAWRVVQQIFAEESGGRVSGAVTEAGAYALVAADPAPMSPPPPVVGAALEPSNLPLSILGTLTGGGSVSPASSPASRVPEAVTAIAHLTLTNESGSLPSGFVLRCEFQEVYQLRDGTQRRPPQYENYVVGYQRPGDALQGTLETDFPMRPSLFFGPEELDSGSVRARVLTPEPFAGALFDPTGGLVVNGSIRLLVGSGDMAGRNAVELRPLSMGAFGEFTNSVLRAAAAFEVTLAGVAPGRRVDVQVAGLATNQLFLLARVVYANGEYGLQPVERLSSDGSGRLRSIEPPSAPRLAGLTGSGQYLLLQLSQPHGLVSGVVTRAAGTAASGLPVRVVGQPWLAFSGADGSWLLVAPPGRASLDVQDPITGNSGTATIEVKDPATAVATSLSLVVAGPRVVGVSPPDGATGVSRISPITVTFNKPVAAASFGAGALTLTGTNGIPIAAGISLNLAGTTATLLPSVQLAPGQAHQLAVSPAIKDLGGAGLEGPREFTFTTETDQLNRQLGQLVLTEPAGGIASMVGSSGTAEPGSQVILVNEATGFTTTVLAGTDGSFSNSIPASVDDPLSAVLLDRNGERTPLPASRQIHADGSVALFSGGGVLEAATPNGPMQVILEPGSIPTKTTFKIDVLPTTEVLTLVNNTPPEGGAVLGGFRFTMTGDPLTASADVSFPIDVSKLVLQPGELPTQRTFALCQPIEQDGVLVYSIIDRMHYEDGHLVTHSPPFPGLGATAAGAILAVPVMMAFGTQVAIAGKAVAVSDDAGLVSNEEVAQGFAVRGGVTYPMIPLAGATVSASPQTLAVLSTPALRPGAVVAHSSYSGAYALLFPNGSLDPDAILIRATHPRFPGMIGSAVVLPAASTEFQPGVIGNPLMRYHGNGSFLDQEAPTLSVSQDGVLLVGVPQVVHFNLRDNASAPMLTSATVVPGDSRALLTGLPLLSSDATIQVGSPHTTGTSSTSYDATVLARVAAIVAVDAVVDDQSGNMATNRIVLRIADPPPAGTNLVASSDPSDSIPPYVVSVNPVDGGIINHGEVVIRFSEPVDQTIVTDPSAVTITPPVPLTRVLSPTQTELLVQCGGLVEGQSYTVTLNSGIVRDLGGNSLGSSFVTRFLTPPSGVVIVPGTHKAVATLALGGVNFTLDQQNGDGALLADLPLGGTQSPTRLGILSLPPFPRAMELIPDYSYKRTTNGVVETKSLIAITGGLLGTGEVGQWLWIVDASNPTNLVRIASELASVDFTSALTAIKWSPPRLAILETRSEGSVIHHVNLQAFILGANGAAAGTPSPGVDANGDGDFVDPGDSLPVPTRGSFFGDEFTTEAPKRRVISDYGVAFGGSFEVAITPALGSAPAFFQVYYWEGMPFVPTSPNDGRITYSGTGSGPPPEPRRVVLDLDFPLVDGTNGVRSIPAAIIAEAARLVIYDLSNPARPLPVRTNQVGSATTLVSSIARAGAQEYAVGTSGGVVILSRPAMGGLNPLDGALVTTIPGLPMQGRTFGAGEAFDSAAYGGIARISVRPPHIRVVQVPPMPVVPIDSLLQSNREARVSFVGAARESRFLLPIPLERCGNGGGELGGGAPPNPLFNYYPMVQMHGTFGPEIYVALESTDIAGRLNPPRGRDEVPVLLSNAGASSGFGSQLAPVQALRLRRLSDDPTDELFNVYLGSPFVIVLQPLSSREKGVVASVPGRQAVWGGDFMRVSLDPAPNGSPALAPYLSTTALLEYRANLSKTYRSIRGEYLDSRNPSFARATPRVAGVNLQSGEFSHSESDLFVEGRGQDLNLTRVYQSQSRYVGPFGRGWDFNYNARILEFPDQEVPAGYQWCLLDRGDAQDQAAPCDALLIDGVGSVQLFRCIHPGDPTAGEVMRDPAVNQFLGVGGTNRVSRFYHSPPGVFSVLYKLSDGKFMLVMPDGSRVHFLPDGRLDRMVGIFSRSVVECGYGADGRLRTVTGDRGVRFEFGYYRRFSDPDFLAPDVSSSRVVEMGRVARVRVSPITANVGDVSFTYDADGNLERAIPAGGAPLVHKWSQQDLHEMVAVGRTDGTQPPGQVIKYVDGMVAAVQQETTSLIFGGAKATARERYAAGNGTVTVAVGAAPPATYAVDQRGRATSHANRPFEADDQGRPTHVAAASSDAHLTYDDANPVYRFRGNVVATSEGKGPFITGTRYDQSAWNRAIALTNVNGDVRLLDYSLAGDYRSAGEVIESTGPVTTHRRHNEYGQPEHESLDDAGGGLPLLRDFSYGSGGLGPDGGLQTARQLAGIAGATTSRDTRGRVHAFSESGLGYTVGYNSDGQPLSMTDLSGTLPQVQLTYLDGRINTETIASAGQVVRNTYVYDSQFGSRVSQLTREETGLPTSVTQYLYDTQGRLLSYTVDGELVKLTHAGNTPVPDSISGGGVERSLKLAAGTAPREIVDQGVKAVFQYDAVGRVQALTQQGTTTRFTYDDANGILRRRLKVKEQVDQTGVLSHEEFRYDGAGRVIALTTAGGRSREFGYFADGALRELKVNGSVMRSVSRTQGGLVDQVGIPGFHWTLGAFDPRHGRPQLETLTLSPSSRTLVRQTTYDGSGRALTANLAGGAALYKYAYDGFGNQIRREDPDGVVTSQSFSPGGHLLSSTFADGHTAEFKFDGHRRVQTVLGGPNPMTFGYDALGFTKTIAWPDGTQSGMPSRNSFLEPDVVTHGSTQQSHTWVDGLLRRIDVQSDVLTYDYDGLGRASAVGFGGVDVQFQYNGNGDVFHETVRSGNTTRVWSIDVDARGRVNFENYPSGLTLAFAPDGIGNPLSVSAVGIQNVDWLSPGMLERVRFSGGLRLVRRYDPLLRTDRISYETGPDASPVVVAGFEYQLTAAGRILSETRLHESRMDLFHRNLPAEGMRIRDFIFSATNAAGAGAQASVTGLAFSQFGELQSPAATAGGGVRGFHPQVTEFNGRIDTADGQPVTYNDQGSVRTVPLWVTLPGGTTLTRVQGTLDYDGLGMLKKVTRSDGPSSVYTRDGLGRIIRRVVSGAPALVNPGTTEYFWAGDRLLEEREQTPGGTQFRRYVYLGNNLVLVQLAPTEAGPFTDRVPLVTLNGSIGGFATPAGGLVETIHYSAYGAPEFIHGEQTGRSTVGNTLLFQGAFYDEATGLYQMGQRNLHPQLGRFLQRDGHLFIASAAMFTAFDGDPAGRIDPHGTSDQPGSAPGGGLNLMALYRNVQGVGSAYAGFDKAMVDAQIDRDRKPVDLGKASIDLITKAIIAATTLSDDEAKAQAKQYTTALDGMKAGLDILQSVANIHESREVLTAIKGMTWGHVAGTEQLKGLFEQGVTAEISSLGGAKEHLFANSDYLAARGELSEGRLPNTLKATESYFDKRTGNLLAIGKGLSTLGGLYLDTALKGNTGPEATAARNLLKGSGDLLAVADAYRKYKDSRDLKMLQTLYGIDLKSAAVALGSSEGISLLGTVYKASNELAQMGIVFFNDPDVGQAYQEAATHFEADGGWLTVAGGLIGSLPGDTAFQISWRIQQYADTDIMGKFLNPVAQSIGFLQQYHESRVRMTESYLNALDAP